MTSYSDYIRNNAALPPSPDNALGTWGGTATRTLSGKLSETVSATDFGAVGDGATDNAAALVAMRDYCESNFQTSGVEINFPPGQYDYTNNLWLPHCDKVVINAYGVKFRNVLNTGEAVRSYPLFNGGIHSDRGTDLAGGYQNRGNYTHTIETVAAGSTTVTLTNAAKASEFVAGAPVFLGGFTIQQSSGPPNLLYFEWNTVASVDGAVITLVAPLKHRYRSDWYTATFTNYGPAGPGTIVPLHRPLYRYAESVTIRGAEFLENPNTTYQALFLVAKTVLLEDVKTNNVVWPQQSHIWRAVRCDFAYMSEIDKLVEIVDIDGCRIGETPLEAFKYSIGSAAGTNKVIVRNSVLEAGLSLSCRSLVVEDTQITSIAQDAATGTLRHQNMGVIRSVVWNRNRVYDDAPDSNGSHIINNTPKTVTIGDAIAGSFKLSPAGLDGPTLMSYFTDGGIVRTADWQTYARVHDITFDGTDFVVHHSSSVTFTSAATLTVHPIRKVRHEDNETWILGNLRNSNYSYLKFAGPQYEDRQNYIYEGSPPLISPATSVTNLNWTGYARTLRYRVIKASTVGVVHRLIVLDGTNTQRELYRGTTTEDGAWLEVDLVKAADGTDYTTATTFHGTWTNTQQPAAATPQPFTGFHQHLIQTAGLGAPAYANDGDLPIFSMEFEGVAPII